VRIAVDISLYPLNADYIPPIRSFIDRLKNHPGLALEYNSLSTQLSGDIDAVFAALKTEMARSFAAPQRSVFVLKMLGGADPPAS
jgi:uncharacterized protein YqgV (UPF0045/DUF77 family)